ncbi:hypothetical protein P3X46_002143 [Hevea brasiliensis]|uniref:Secreted protein n=1 Tax=Hevea brasiliensis TaxID=3981 RepID=A0ABQ9N5I6_HEVBR|nr:hypothetical protein P3X46_002143 [Hevea brasiliensis]
MLLGRFCFLMEIVVKQNLQGWVLAFSTWSYLRSASSASSFCFPIILESGAKLPNIVVRFCVKDRNTYHPH